MLLSTTNHHGFSTTKGLIVILIIAIALGLISLKFEQRQANNNNNIRMSDLRAIQISLEKYYLITNHYPSLNEINNPSWRNNNLSGLSSKDLTDPGWKSNNKYCTLNGQSILIPNLESDCYQYIPTTNNNQSCSTKATTCLKYSLGAKLQDGRGVYLRQNLA